MTFIPDSEKFQRTRIVWGEEELAQNVDENTPLPVQLIGSVGADAQQIQGVAATSAVAVGNPVSVGGVVATTNPVNWVAGDRAELQFATNGSAFVSIGTALAAATIGQPSDDQAGSSALLCFTRGQGFNGATYDVLRTIPSLATSGIGVAAAGMVGQYLATPPTLTDGQYGRGQLATDGSVRTVLVAAQGGSQDAIAATNVTTVSIVGQAASPGQVRPLLVGSYVFNGTTWDRARGDTGGAYSIQFNNIFFIGTTTPLAAGATFTSTSRDNAGGNIVMRYAYFNAYALADQAGIVRVELSNDGTTWFRATADVAMSANNPVFLQVPVIARFYRQVIVNGATLQTSFISNSSYSVS